MRCRNMSSDGVAAWQDWDHSQSIQARKQCQVGKRATWPQKVGAHSPGSRSALHQKRWLLFSQEMPRGQNGQKTPCHSMEMSGSFKGQFVL